MKALIIGANGFLGSHLAIKLLKKDWKITAVYNKNYSLIPKSCQKVSVKNIKQLKDDFQIVFLFAAYIPYGNMNMFDNKLVESNMKLVNDVVKQFRNAKIIYSSSVAVYGENSNQIDENSCFKNPDLYGLSKLIGESIVKKHSQYQILRFSSLYGKGMQNTFMNRIISEVTNTKKISLYGNPDRKQDYLNIDDALGYCLAAVSNLNNGTFLAVSGKSFSNLQIANYIKKNVPEAQIRFLDQAQHYPSFAYNNILTRKILNFSPSVSIQDGIKSLLN